MIGNLFFFFFGFRVYRGRDSINYITNNLGGLFSLLKNLFKINSIENVKTNLKIL